jgi:hypothetical protein
MTDPELAAVTDVKPEPFNHDSSCALSLTLSHLLNTPPATPIPHYIPCALPSTST